MGRREDMVKLAESLMNDREHIRNIGVVAHIDHGKTTMTDNLIAAAGLMSEELAGRQRMMDYYQLEQDRGITINAANISLVHEFKGKKNGKSIFEETRFWSYSIMKTGEEYPESLGFDLKDEPIKEKCELYCLRNLIKRI